MAQTSVSASETPEASSHEFHSSASFSFHVLTPLFSALVESQVNDGQTWPLCLHPSESRLGFLLVQQLYCIFQGYLAKLTLIAPQCFADPQFMLFQNPSSWSLAFTFSVQPPLSSLIPVTLFKPYLFLQIASPILWYGQYGQQNCFYLIITVIIYKHPDPLHYTGHTRGAEIFTYSSL